MKKNNNKVILLVLLLLPILSYSQVKFGVKGTVQRTNVSKIHKESGGRTAGSIGGIAQIPLGYDNQFFIQTEIIYSLEGEKDEGTNAGGYTRNTKYSQNYINIPIMFRTYFSEDDNEFFGELGPQLGFLAHQKSKEEDIKYYSKPQTFNLSIGAGIGYSFLRKYEVSIRYNYGLTDVYKDYYGQQRTSNFAFTLAYMFN